jgi:hypothetical protein
MKKPTLTRLERFVWDNRDRSAHALATELCRTISAIECAYNRAYRKNKDIETINTARASQNETSR